MMSALGKLAPATELRLPEQKEFDGKVFPLAVSPGNNSLDPAFTDIASLVEWVRNQRETFDSLLLEYGAIFFRGFPINDPSDFDAFVKVCTEKRSG